MARPRCPIPRAGGPERERILPRKRRPPAGPARSRESSGGGGEEEGSGRGGGDLPGLDDSHGQSPNPRQPREGCPFIGQESAGAQEGSATPGEGEGRGGSRLPVDATPLQVYALHSSFPGRGRRKRGGRGACAPTQPRLARSSDEARGSREKWRGSAAAYLSGPRAAAAAAAAPGERQVALQLRAAFRVRHDHGVRQDPGTGGVCGRTHSGSRDRGPQGRF